MKGIAVPAALLLVLTAQGCGDATSSSGPPNDSIPTHRHEFAIGDTVVDTLSFPRLWLFSGTAGDELNVFLGAESRDPADRDRFLALWLTDSAGTPRDPFYLVQSAGNDTILEMHSGGRFTLPSSGRYGVQIAWCCGTMPYAGPFRFWIYRINRAPESVDATLPAADSISAEAIDHVGDIDTYHYSAAPGQWFNLFFHARGGGYTTALFAWLPARDGGIRSTGLDTALTQHALGRFVDSAGGSRVLQVYGESDRDITDRGPYQLFLYPINWAPEIGPADLAPGDSVTTETIELLGDVDQFHLAAPGSDSVEVNAALTLLAPNPGDGLGIGLSDQPALLSPPKGVIGIELVHGTGDTWLQPGRAYTLSIGAFSQVPGYVGPYALHVHAIDRRPETAPALVAIGDTLAGESLDPLGDIDTFDFDATAGDQLTVYVQGMGTDTAGSLRLRVKVPGKDSILAETFTPGGAPELTGQQTGRFIIPWTGRWQIEVAADHDGIVAADRGPYRFFLARYPTAPETHAVNFSIGDSVTTEAIDYAGDVDEFLLNGAAGQSTIVLFQTLYGGGELELVDPVTRLAFQSIVSSGYQQSSGMISLPASGQLLVRASGALDDTGPYRIVASANGPGPERIGAQVAIGDTVSGEEIKPDGDFDEFQFTATAGRQLSVFFQTPLGIYGLGIVLEAVDPATNAILGSVTSTGPTATLEDLETGPFTIPQDGRYLIRVRSVEPTYGTTYQPGYRFRIAPLN